jgi:hypothetical protein
MDRRTFLKQSCAASLLPLWPRGLTAGQPATPSANSAVRRARPSDPGWPSKEAWKRLNDAVGGNLIAVEFPINACS